MSLESFDYVCQSDYDPRNDEHVLKYRLVGIRTLYNVVRCTCFGEVKTQLNPTVST